MPLPVTKHATTVAVTALAANASVVVAHGLLSEGYGLVPSKIDPAGASHIKVVSADTENITFKNVGVASESMTFEASWDADMEAGGKHAWYAGISSESQVRLHTTTPAAKSATGVHANYLGDNVSLAFPGPFTNPAQPRNVTCTFEALWDAGNITVTGTDQFDVAQTEVIVANAGAAVLGTKIFKTVTAAAKGAVGAAKTVSIGTGDKIGVTSNLVENLGLLFVDRVAEAVTVDAAVEGFTPTTAPNGAKVFQLLANVAV